MLLVTLQAKVDSLERVEKYHGAAGFKRSLGKLFAKILRQVEVAAREGGGDPEANPTLRTMFQKARDASVPMDTIDRAIKRGTGELEGVTYESITYEGYAPGGVAVLVETLTDNTLFLIPTNQPVEVMIGKDYFVRFVGEHTSGI